MGIPVNDESVKQHFNLVRKIARKLQYNIRDNAISYDDLFSEGCIGLMKALQSYDASTGNQFSSFAYRTIEGYMMRFINARGCPIRFPPYAALWANAITKADLQNEEPWAIASKLGCAEFYVKQALEYLQVRDIYSLDLPMRDVNNQDSEEDHSYWAKTEDDMSHLSVEEFLNTLNPQKRLIVELSMEGYKGAHMARIIGISQQAINKHKSSVAEKFASYQRSKVKPRPAKSGRYVMLREGVAL